MICSAVKPPFGYVNSVRMVVCVRGEEIEFREIMEGEFSWLRLEFERLCWRFEMFEWLEWVIERMERCRDRVRKGARIEEEPEGVGR